MTNAQTAVLAAASLTAPQGATLTSVAQRLAVKTAIQNWLDKGSDLNNGDPIACTFTDTGDLVGDVAHGLVAGNVVVFDSVVSTTGLTADHKTEYYVIAGGLTADAFKVSATAGGSAVALTTDGTGTYHRRTGSVLATRQAVCLAACSAFDSDDWQLPKQITDYCDIIATAYDVG